MTQSEQVHWMQNRTAEIAVGVSTLRGRPSGTIANARNFLKSIDLQQFKTQTEEDFQKQLDSGTNDLAKFVDWGGARKVLNIFLRDVLYNYYLRENFGFGQIEKWLELPLDGHVAKSLLVEPEGKNLPQWNGIIRLNSGMSKQYQDTAKQVAARHGIYPVSLDLIYWRAEKFSK
jgi:hypothetical protein